MSNLFGGLTSAGLEETQDRVGGFQPFDTDIHLATIKAFYAGQSEKGARNVTILADIGGKEYRETVYVTNRKGENFFLNRDDKTKKVPLPGFVVIEDICLVTVEKPLEEVGFEDKIMNVYDSEAKKEVPKSVPMATEMLGKQVYLGIVRNLENKSQSDGAGGYTPIADTRETNTIEKVFHHPSKITVVEARNGQTEPQFFDAWEQRNKGVTRDRRTIKEGGDAGNAGRPGSRAPASAPQAGAGTAPRKSLFGG